ncbi:MAG: hypothetical protein LUC38_01995, partial [Oscillospiraceae bacterium]|nr:hypothetical protein [Oscillospiraceae bacterium]
MKRFLSILTAIALCLCTFTMTVTATEPISSSGLSIKLEVSSNVNSKAYTYSGDSNSIGVYVSKSGIITFGATKGKYSSITNYAYGVYIEDGGTVTISGGTFSSNNCGIYVGGSNSTLGISGATVISGNSYTSNGKTVDCNVYLDDGALITLSTLSSGASIGVTTNTKPTANNPVQITTAETTTTRYKTAVDYFFSDDPTYDIRINETGGYLELYLPVESTVTADKNIENGSVTFSSDTAYSGTTVTVTPEADKGYEVDEVTYTYNNGTKDVTTTITPSNGVYSFTMPDYAVTVSATFKASVYNVSTSRCSNGSVAVSSTSAIADTTITVTPTADEGYEVDTVSYTYNDGTDDITTTLTASEGVYSFTMPYYNVTVSATFKKSVSETEPIDSSEL